MEISGPYQPSELFLSAGAHNHGTPRAFIAPHRYLQGAGTLHGMGGYLKQLDFKHAGLLISTRGAASEGKAIEASLNAQQIEQSTSLFQGECSLEEIARHVEAFHKAKIDCVVAVGGGKCIDAGKAVAFRCDLPMLSVPSLASNDAPCSALSVLYSSEGVSTGAEFYPRSPCLVVVDTAVIAAAPERYLVAGMGDAMAIWYEAQICLEQDKAINCLGTRPTSAAAAIGQRCAEVLFERGAAAASAVRRNHADAALEDIVEANTLLSGIGFESGGLAGAHGVAQAFTAIPSVEREFLHGEMVAMGTLTQLLMVDQRQEARKVADFFAAVGLPIHLAQMGLGAKGHDSVSTIAQETLAFPFIGNMPGQLSADRVADALRAADTLGRSVNDVAGDAAYQRLHG